MIKVFPQKDVNSLEVPAFCELAKGVLAALGQLPDKEMQVLTVVVKVHRAVGCPGW